MIVFLSAQYLICDCEYCDGCHAVSDWTSTCYGTDQ